MTYFTYNGRSSAEFGLHIEKKDVFSAPEYDAEFISIPGRSGDIINPNRRFANIKVTYTVFLARKNVAALTSNLRDIKGWLYSEPDRYHELTDSNQFILLIFILSICIKFFHYFIIMCSY